MYALSHYTREAQRAQDYADALEHHEATLANAMRLDYQRQIQVLSLRMDQSVRTTTMTGLSAFEQWMDEAEWFALGDLLQMAIKSDDEKVRLRAECLINAVAGKFARHQADLLS